MRPSTDGRDTRNARGRATVRAIEVEAVRLAVLNGPAALTVDQICQGVGISQRSFFNHFDTKEDALLGWDLPQISEQRSRDYLADPTTGVLTGAIGLVEVPRHFLDDLELTRSRFELLSSTPGLAERQAARLRPLATQVAQVVFEKLRSLADPDADPTELRRAASTITTIAAALVAQPDLEVGGPRRPDPVGVAGALEQIRWVWGRLI